MSWLNISESRARNIDAYCKLVGTVALVVAGVWTLVTYVNAKEKELESAVIEAKKPFLSKRLEVYSDLLRIAYKIDDTSQAIRMSREEGRKTALTKVARGQSARVLADAWPH